MKIARKVVANSERFSRAGCEKFKERARHLNWAHYVRHQDEIFTCPHIALTLHLPQHSRKVRCNVAKRKELRRFERLLSHGRMYVEVPAYAQAARRHRMHSEAYMGQCRCRFILLHTPHHRCGLCKGLMGDGCLRCAIRTSSEWRRFGDANEYFFHLSRGVVAVARSRLWTILRER